MFVVKDDDRHNTLQITKIAIYKLLRATVKIGLICSTVVDYRLFFALLRCEKDMKDFIPYALFAEKNGSRGASVVTIN